MWARGAGRPGRRAPAAGPARYSREGLHDLALAPRQLRSASALARVMDRMEKVMGAVFSSFPSRRLGSGLLSEARPR